MIDPFWEMSRYLYRKKYDVIARLFEVLSMMVSSHAISAKIEVGDGTIFYHHGLGRVVLETTHIGKNVKVFPNVTIGNTFSDTDKSDCGRKYCSIGDNCMIGAGAVIIGNVHIGRNVSVGANAVVLDDCPDNVVVAGVPARIKRVKTSEEL